jgi:hypothetical protein
MFSLFKKWVSCFTASTAFVKVRDKTITILLLIAYSPEREGYQIIHRDCFQVHRSALHTDIATPFFFCPMNDAIRKI